MRACVYGYACDRVCACVCVQVHHNAGAGVRCDDASEATLHKNRVAHNALAGVCMSRGCGAASITNNDLHHNGAEGLALKAATNSTGDLAHPFTFSGNKVRSNVGWGLKAEQCDSVIQDDKENSSQNHLQVEKNNNCFLPLHIGKE